MKQKVISAFFLIVLALSLLSACAPAGSATGQPPATSAPTIVNPTVAATKSATQTASATGVAPADTTKDDAYAEALTFNNSAWKYDAANDVYWQIGVKYCAKPAATDYETLGIYIPGAYLTATANGDGTYTAKVNEKGALNGFTASTAPMVFPVNTPGYSAQKPPTAYSYDGVSSYLKAGFIYVAAGMRGKDNGYTASGQLSYSGGAPWGVTDLKAAVRFIRYNQAVLPGDEQAIFAFGMSGGGAQTAIIGASGDSQLYYPYLESIGAAMFDANGQPISDAITGAMAWCPITSLDFANQAYEWNMGQYATSGTRADGTFTAALSKDLAAAYATYINKLGLKDENGNALTLQASSSGIYTTGSYQDYLVKTVETSLNNFLVDTTFPYTETAGGMTRTGGSLPTGTAPQGTPPAGTAPLGTPPAGGLSGGSSTSTTYQTVQDYMDALNKNGQWVTYNAATNTAKITSLAGFVNSQKAPSKSVGAFDSLDRSSPENGVFGNDANDALHFDALLANLLVSNQSSYASKSGWNASYLDAFATDLKATDKLGNGLEYRINMYNPMYYLLPYYKGYQTATVAKYWRINTGIKQGDTATTVEMNLALALEAYQGVNDVDFTTVWGQSHVQAERTGSSTTNFIAWVIETMQK